MIILGLLFLAVAAVAAVELVLANQISIPFHMWRWHWQIDAFWLVVAGAAVIVVALMGLAMLKGAGGRARRLRRERRELAAENRRLAERAAVAEAGPAGPAGHVSDGRTAPNAVEPVEGRHVVADGAVPADGQNGFPRNRVEQPR